MRVVTESYTEVTWPAILECVRILFCEKSGREYRISVCGVRYGRTVQARRCIADLVLLLGKGVRANRRRQYTPAPSRSKS